MALILMLRHSDTVNIDFFLSFVGLGQIDVLLIAMKLLLPIRSNNFTTSCLLSRLEITRSSSIGLLKQEILAKVDNFLKKEGL